MGRTSLTIGIPLVDARHYVRVRGHHNVRDVCQASNRQGPITTMESLRVVVGLEKRARRHVVERLAVARAPVDKHRNRECSLRERDRETREVVEEVRVRVARLVHAVGAVLPSRDEVDGSVSDAVSSGKELQGRC